MNNRNFKLLASRKFAVSHLRLLKFHLRSFCKHQWGLHKEKDIQEFKRVSNLSLSTLEEMWLDLDNKPVLPRCEPGFLKKKLNMDFKEHGCEFSSLLPDLKCNILNNIVNFSHKGFLSWFPCRSSPLGALGQCIYNSLRNQENLISNTSISIELEKCITQWFAKSMNLPDNLIEPQSGARVIDGISLSSSYSTLAAKARAIKSCKGISPHLFKYYSSEQAHYSLRKSANIAGSNTEIIPVIL